MQPFFWNIILSKKVLLKVLIFCKNDIGIKVTLNVCNGMELRIDLIRTA